MNQIIASALDQLSGGVILALADGLWAGWLAQKSVQEYFAHSTYSTHSRYGTLYPHFHLNYFAGPDRNWLVIGPRLCG
jgi:hypothetical protein